jgi:hypothetical protein
MYKIALAESNDDAVSNARRHLAAKTTSVSPQCCENHE